MKKLLTIVFSGALALTVASQPSEVHADGYGVAGCGLGSMLIKDNSMLMQIFAGTTNGTFASQLFGITSGTSNCKTTTAGIGSAKAFVETNREAVAKDISRGSGETIDTLAVMGGCSDAGAVGAKLQQSFTEIFPASAVSDERVSDTIVNVLSSDKALGCTKLSQG